MTLNPQILELVKIVIDSDLPKATREDIVRFFTLPRITPATPAIETPPKDDEVGVVPRPDTEEVELYRNKNLREETQEMDKTLKQIEEQDEPTRKSTKTVE